MPPSTFTITYSKPGTVPPIFVAGSFSSPPWEPQRLDQDGRDCSGSFTRTFSVSPGTYQYKFRLGTGDWWVIDETQKTATDDQGNVNNVLIVEDDQEVSASLPAAAPAKGDVSAKAFLENTASADAFLSPERSGLPPVAPLSEISVQAEDGPAHLLSQAKSPAVAEVTSVTSVSHELPTPPISEGGDDIECKETPVESPGNVSHDPADSTEAPKGSGKEESPGVASPEWNRIRAVLLLLAVAVIPVLAWSLSR